MMKPEKLKLDILSNAHQYASKQSRGAQYRNIFDIPTELQISTHHQNSQTELQIKMYWNISGIVILGLTSSKYRTNERVE